IGPVTVRSHHVCHARPWRSHVPSGHRPTEGAGSGRSMTREAIVTLDQPAPAEVAKSFPAPCTVLEYSSAIEQFNSGRFLHTAREKARAFFACMYGGPFFALATLAPELLNGDDVNLVFGGEIRPLAEDGGRWLSLYARALRYSGKLSCTVCSMVKPKLGRTPQSILAQPPQRIIAKEWARHLKEIDDEP